MKTSGKTSAKTAIIIPSRMNSTRFPRKSLAMLKGAKGDERSLVERCFMAASEVDVDAIYVATDHEEIAEHVRGFGGIALMTPESCRNGTERCAALLDQVDADLIINFQGDAPLIPSDFVTALIDHMKAHRDAEMATPVMPCNREILQALIEDRKHGQVGGTTAAVAADGRALYFSKEVLPIADKLIDTDPASVYLHVGLYAYRREVLAQYASWPQGHLEMIEGLEQLRFLENGRRVDCVKVDAKGRGFWEVNNPSDVALVETALKQRGIK